MKYRRSLTSRLLYEQYRRRLRDQKGFSTEKPTKESAPSERFQGRKLSSAELVISFFRLIRGQASLLALALAMLTLTTLLGLVPPAGTKVLIDNVLGDKPLPAFLIDRGLPTDRLQLLIIGVVAVLLISWLKSILQVWSRWYALVATTRVQVSVGRRLLEHTIRLPLHRIYDLKSGGATSALRQDATHVGDLIFTMVFNPWRAVTQLGGSLCILAWVDWRLVAGSLVTMPLVYFTHRTWIAGIRPQHLDARLQRESVDAAVTEAFGGMRVVRSFSRERGEAARFVKGNHLHARMKLRNWWNARVVELLWLIVTPLAAAFLLLYGGYAVLNETLSVGQLVMFLVYMLMLLSPLAVLAESAANFQNGLSALERVLALLEEPREALLTSGTAVPLPTEGERGITFEGVSFCYPGTTEFNLQDINLVVEPGETIALVGASGAGKTTLCNLVARFHDPTEGRILLDGVDLRKFDVHEYRRILGVVDQDVFLFDGTIAENVGYADRNATLDEIREAARLANADEFIRQLPDGYETVVGERGVKLSGGQRQRLAIARAILADPGILILDEATSNLDTHSERLIKESLETLMASRTSFVIAHRLSTITHADRILVMDAGQIVEEGTHQQLLAGGGHYRAMIERQMGAESKNLGV